MTQLESKTCCFTGHRAITKAESKAIVKQLQKEIETLIDRGYLYFGAGGALGFDTLAARVVLKLRKRHPQIKLILVLPCTTQTKGWSKKDQSVHEKIKGQADKVVYTSQEYSQACMHKRNRHLVDYSSVCLCYLTEKSGGTAYTVRYAIEHGVSVINIAEVIGR